MRALARPIGKRSSWIVPMLFAAGFVVLVGAWALLYSTESMFTEAFLGGYYCCATEQDLPQSGTLERTLSDFFQTSPGKHLPSLLFVGANVALFAFSLRRQRKLVWWLPWLLIALTVLYILADFELMVFSWAISNRLVGPRTSVYAGYERTWYGIALHLVLWTAFLATVSALLRRLLPSSRAVSQVEDE